MMAAQFGNFFRQHRQTLGLSLREFCRRNGFDPGNISRLERGLLTPPRSAEVLESYAKALKLDPKSQAWVTFADLAALETGRIPPQMAHNPEALDNMQKTFRALQHQTKWKPWTKATDLELWASYLDARAQLPRLIRRLIHATVDPILHIEFPAGEGVQRLGWDGIVETTSGNAFVPSGLSVWEMGVSQDPGKKAAEDFHKRIKNPLGLDPRQTCFVFVTPRKWLEKNDWCNKKRQLGKWRDVRVYDSVNLEEWLETAYGTDVWMARLLGRRPEGVIDIEEHWDNLSALTEPSLKPEVFLTSREKEIKIFEEWLGGPPSALAFEAPSPAEILDFLAAYTASREDSARDKIESRIVIVADTDQWHVLCAAHNRLLLIPKPHLPIEAEMVAEAVRQGHYVLLSSHRFAGEHITKHELSRPYRHELEKALASSGITEEEARRLAREVGGSLTVLKRRLARFPNTSLPEWSQPHHAQDLIPMLLVGGWDDTNAGDRAILAKLAGRSYEEALSVATRWLAGDDPPLIRLLTRWSLVSHEDSWLLLAQHISRPQLDLFEKVAVEVLSEDDPRYDLPPNERWSAALHGKLPKYSDQLRSGIAETLALLGAKPDPIQDSTPPARRTDRVIAQLLTIGITWKRWASLRNVLPILAETAPDVFLKAVKDDIEAKEPQLSKLFVDEDKPLFSSCMYAGLLWALETLAWEPSLLTQVSSALARLERIAPRGRWANRPINSLREIFLPWLPQTTASVEQRIKVLKVLTQRVSDIGWRLLLDLLPTFHEISMPTCRPHWRDWILNWSQGATNAEHWQQVEACADLLVELAGTDMGHWVQVFEKFENFPPPAQDRLIHLLSKIDLGTLNTTDRRLITDKLREKIHRHRSFPNADWALPSDKLDVLETIKRQFEPEDLVTRHSWLFTPHPELVADPDDENAFEKREEELFRLRQEALHEILDCEGLQQVLKLVEKVEDPWGVGFVLGKAKLFTTDSSILPSLLATENRNLIEFATAYGRGRFIDAGWEWIRQIGIDQWTPEQAGRLLAYAPYCERKTWDVVEKLGEEVITEYWSRIFSLRHDAPAEDVEYAVTMLLKFNRPFLAVRILDRALRRKHEFDSSLLMYTLEASLKSQEQNPAGYEIQQFFKRLQTNPNVDMPRLARLEWSYLSLLNGRDASPETLIQFLRTEPRFFADLISLIFRSDKESEESAEAPTEEQKARALSAYGLLMEWKSVPGLQEDNTTVDEQELLTWVRGARRLCEESGRLVMCDLRIGEVLAYSPEECNGTWPCIAVRDVIEEVNSTNLIQGFETGIFNKRGVVMKSPFVGGDQEHERAKKYASYAEACAIEWPTTAAALRRVARHYEEYARREDEEAKWRALK